MSADILTVLIAGALISLAQALGIEPVIMLPFAGMVIGWVCRMWFDAEVGRRRIRQARSEIVDLSLMDDRVIRAFYATHFPDITREEIERGVGRKIDWVGFPP